MTTIDLLDEFISHSSNDDNIEKLIFLQDMSLCQGIIAWKNLKITFVNAEIDFSNLDNDSWNALWDYSEFEIDDFATLVGKNYSEAEDLLKRLIFLKYVYPDGRVNDIALAYSKNISKNMISKVLSKSKGEKSNGREN